MFTLKFKLAHTDMSSFLKKYQDVDKFLSYCKECTNYNHKWSCPPLAFSPTEYLNQYKYIYLIAVQINYAQSTINELTTKEDINKFTRQTLRKIKNQTATQLLGLENAHSISFSSGGCSYCCKCSRLNNQPCKKPEKMRYSLDSFGIDLGKVTENLLDIKLLWGLDKLPKYHTLIHALATNELLDEQYILNILTND